MDGSACFTQSHPFPCIAIGCNDCPDMEEQLSCSFYSSSSCRGLFFLITTCCSNWSFHYYYLSLSIDIGIGWSLFVCIFFSWFKQTNDSSWLLYLHLLEINLYISYHNCSKLFKLLTTKEKHMVL